MHGSTNKPSDEAPQVPYGSSSEATSRGQRLLLLLRRGAAGLCLFAAYMAAQSEFDRRWVLMTIVAAIVVASGNSFWDRDEPEPPRLSWPNGRVWVLAVLPGWILLGLSAVGKLSGVAPQVLITVWCAGLLWTLVGAWSLSLRESDSKINWRLSPELLLGMGTFAVAVVLRLTWLDTVPHEVHVDEAFTTANALILYAQPDRDWFGASMIMNFFYLAAGAGTLPFGVNLFGARVSDVLYGALSVLLLLLALWRMTSWRVALIGALLLAFNHTHLAYSRNAAGYIQVALVVSAIMALVSRLWTAPTYLNAVLLGVVVALAPQTVPASVAAPLLAVATGGLLVLLHWRRVVALFVPLLFVAVTLGAAAAPFLVGIWQNRAGLLSRTGDVSIFSPHNMEKLKSTVWETDSVLRVVAAQAWTGLTGFQNGRNAQPQYASGQPMADPYTAALLIPGLVFILSRPRRLASVVLTVFGAGYLVLGLGMNYAMGYQRAVGAIPPSMGVAAIGLVQCVEALFANHERRERSGRRRWPSAAGRDLVLVAAVVLCASANLFIYLIDCSASLFVADAGSEAQWVTRQFNRDYNVHLVTAKPPTLYDVNLIIADTPVSYNEKGLDALAYVQSVQIGAADLFVIHSDDVAASDWLRMQFPSARQQVWHNHPVHGPTLSLIFVTEPGVCDDTPSSP